MVIMLLGRGVRVTGVMVDGVIMVLGVRVTGVMVDGVIMVLGVRVTGVMVGIADNTFFGRLRYINDVTVPFSALND
jgi:hypothetical protein